MCYFILHLSQLLCILPLLPLPLSIKFMISQSLYFLPAILCSTFSANSIILEAQPGYFMISRADPFDNSVAFHLGVIKQLMAPLRTVVNSAAQLRSTASTISTASPQHRISTYQSKEQPPSGHFVSKSSLFFRISIVCGWRSHLTGNPSYK